MIQNYFPRVTHPMVSSTFWAHYGMLFPMYAGKGKYYKWLTNKVEIYFPKIGLVACEWSNLNVSRSFTPCCPFAVDYGIIFAEKGNAACGTLTKRKFISKYVLHRLQMVQFGCPRFIHPMLSFTFLVHPGWPFPQHAGKGKCCLWLVN